MIALLDGLPLVRFDESRTEHFRRDWMLRSIIAAAGRAGYRDWWLAEHVEASISAYLQHRSEENVITVQWLGQAVRSVLQTIGYGDVAAEFSPEPPVAQLLLPHLAEEAGAGFELTFFALLDERLQQLSEQQPRCVEILGLNPCVKMLAAQKRWSRRCGRLRDDIVTHVRRRMAAAPVLQETLFALS